MFQVLLFIPLFLVEAKEPQRFVRCHSFLKYFLEKSASWELIKAELDRSIEENGLGLSEVDFLLQNLPIELSPDEQNISSEKELEIQRLEEKRKSLMRSLEAFFQEFLDGEMNSAQSANLDHLSSILTEFRKFPLVWSFAQADQIRIWSFDQRIPEKMREEVAALAYDLIGFQDLAAVEYLDLEKTSPQFYEKEKVRVRTNRLIRQYLRWSLDPTDPIRTQNLLTSISDFQDTRLYSTRDFLIFEEIFQRASDLAEPHRTRIQAVSGPVLSELIKLRDQSKANAALIAREGFVLTAEELLAAHSSSSSHWVTVFALSPHYWPSVLARLAETETEDAITQIEKEASSWAGIALIHQPPFHIHDSEMISAFIKELRMISKSSALKLWLERLPKDFFEDDPHLILLSLEKHAPELAKKLNEAYSDLNDVGLKTLAHDSLIKNPDPKTDVFLLAQSRLARDLRSKFRALRLLGERNKVSFDLMSETERILWELSTDFEELPDDFRIANLWHEQGTDELDLRSKRQTKFSLFQYALLSNHELASGMFQEVVRTDEVEFLIVGLRLLPFLNERARDSTDLILQILPDWIRLRKIYGRPWNEVVEAAKFYFQTLLGRNQLSTGQMQKFKRYFNS